MNHKCSKNHSFKFSTFPHMPKCLFVSLHFNNFKIVLCVFGFPAYHEHHCISLFHLKFLVGMTFCHLKALTQWLTV